MLFDKKFIIYLIISFTLTAILLLLSRSFVKKQETKNFILKITAIAVIAIHYSSLWVEFFDKGEAIADSSMLLPAYPCNICMWLLLIVAFKKNQNSEIFKILAEFTFWAGLICATIGLVFNENYANTPDFRDYEIFKGLLSHSVLIFGSLFLLVMGYVKIRVHNTFSALCGLSLFVVIGTIINKLYAIFDLEPCNAMYLLENPFPNLPWLSPYLMGIAALLLVFAITAFVELVTLPKEQRWHTKIKNYIALKREEKEINS